MILLQAKERLLHALRPALAPENALARSMLLLSAHRRKRIVQTTGNERMDLLTA
jgi:hypothetical protein